MIEEIKEENKEDLEGGQKVKESLKDALEEMDNKLNIEMVDEGDIETQHRSTESDIGDDKERDGLSDHREPKYSLHGTYHKNIL